MPSPAPRTTFGDALRTAIDRRGLPLARVQAHLARAGHPVAQSTLSQWQRGHRCPRSPRSLAIVDELEGILQTGPGVLRRLAEGEASDLSPRMVPVVTQSVAVDAMVADLGAPPRDLLRMVGAHDRLELGPGGEFVRRTTMATMRATGRTDRHVIAHTVDPGNDVDQVAITAVRGCRLGRVVCNPELGLVAAEIHFDRWLSVGDTVAYEFVIDDLCTEPSNDYFRWTQVELAHFVLEVVFDRALRPATVTAFERSREEAPDRFTHELSLEHGERAHLVRAPAEPGLHGIRWEWPTIGTTA